MSRSQTPPLAGGAGQRGTRAWVDGQVALTTEYLSAIPAQQSLKDRFAVLWNYERFSALQEGDRYFFRHNDGLQNHSVLYTADSLSSAARPPWTPTR